MQIYPGLRKLQDTKSFPCKHRIDTNYAQQSIKGRSNLYAKTTGGIKSFAVDNTSVLKWTLNRSEQAKNTAELLCTVGVQSASDVYKPLRLSQILQV